MGTVNGTEESRGEGNSDFGFMISIQKTVFALCRIALDQRVAGIVDSIISCVAGLLTSPSETQWPAVVRAWMICPDSFSSFFPSCAAAALFPFFSWCSISAFSLPMESVSLEFSNTLPIYIYDPLS